MFVVDVETTGIYPERNSIVSIGAVEFSNPQNQFYQECRIFPEAEIMPKALEINGFTYEQITDPSKPTLEEAIREFIAWLDGTDSTKLLLGENPWFDRDFINASASRYGVPKPFGKRIIDLHTTSYNHQLSREIIPPELRSRDAGLPLDFTLSYTGLPPEPKPHHGLTGAKMEAEAYSRLMHGKNLLEEFKKHLIPPYLHV
tara:strand:- start:275 stop:877 length:603 start_codon:yes stop_codon:yes gene_type:complete